MPVIHLSTYIKAPLQRVFDLSRSIDLHTKSMSHTSEHAVAGRTSGLIAMNETVTWGAKHLFKKRYLTTVITQMQFYTLFVDEMQEGDFKMMKHEHHFIPYYDGTQMTDIFTFQSPCNLLGRFVNACFLTNYMKQLLQKRNDIIKQYAETEQWKTVLNADV